MKNTQKNTLVIKQIGLPLRGRPIFLITRMITDQTGLHSVLLPLLISLISIDFRYQLTTSGIYVD